MRQKSALQKKLSLKAGLGGGLVGGGKEVSASKKSGGATAL